MPSSFAAHNPVKQTELPFPTKAAPLTVDLLNEAIEQVVEHPYPDKPVLVRPHTRWHSEVRVPGDPKGTFRIVRNDRLSEYGL